MKTGWDWIETPFGRGYARVEDGRLAELHFDAPRDPGPGRNPSAVAPFRARIARYFATGKGTLGKVKLPGATDFARRVYRAVAAIPAGRLRTYGEIARAAGRPRAARAVGTLMSRNPVALGVP